MKEGSTQESSLQCYRVEAFLRGRKLPNEDVLRLKKTEYSVNCIYFVGCNIILKVGKGLTSIILGSCCTSQKAILTGVCIGFISTIFNNISTIFNNMSILVIMFNIFTHVSLCFCSVSGPPSSVLCYNSYESINLS